MSTPRGQRIILTTVLALGLLVAGIVISADRPARAAIACGAGDSYRNELKLAHTAHTMTPCLSGTNTRVSVERSCVASVCASQFKVSEIRRLGREKVTYADGSSEQLWHFSFKALQVSDNLRLQTTNNSGAQLTITPDAAAQIGGTNDSGDAMYTDVWVSDGTFFIAASALGSVLSCTVPIPAGSGLVELVQGSDIRGCGLQLDAKYLVSYSSETSTKGNFPLRLPQTKLEVGR